MTTTGLVYDEIYLQHDTGPHHPEGPQRLTAIYETLETAGLLDKLLLIKSEPADHEIIRQQMHPHTCFYFERRRCPCR